MREERDRRPDVISLTCSSTDAGATKIHNAEVTGRLPCGFHFSRPILKVECG